MSPGARKAQAAAPVRFRGPPQRLSSLIELPDVLEDRPRATALLEGAEVQGVGVRTQSGEGGLRKLTLRLPKSTPPGTYDGAIDVGGARVPVRVEVEPRPRLEASPSRLTFEVGSKTQATATVTLLNVGNVPFQIPAASKFCVFDGTGVDHAFFVALASDLPEGKERIDVLLDDLAGLHGGLVELRARAENRTIAPGEAQEVELTLSFSDRLQPGRDYAGSWDADGLHVRIRVHVPEAKRTPKAASR